MNFIQCNGVDLCYEERGAGNTTLLFVHGWTCDKSFFAPQMEYFASRFRVIAPDLRGHGQSSKPRGGYPIEAYSQDLEQLVEKLDVRRFIAIGHSMGGSIVLDMATSHLPRLAAIIMVDPASFVRSPSALASVAILLEHIEAGDKQYQRDFIVNHRFLPTSDSAVVDQVATSMLATPNYVAVSAMKGLLDFDAISAAKQCLVPALHVAAQPPLNAPHLMSQYLPNVINGWTVGSGHFNQLEAPEQVNSMIDRFIRCYVVK